MKSKTQVREERKAARLAARQTEWSRKQEKKRQKEIRRAQKIAARVIVQEEKDLESKEFENNLRKLIEDQKLTPRTFIFPW